MSRVEGVLGPWRVSGRSVKDMRERREAAEAETVVSQDAAPLRDNPSDAGPSDAPSDASEQLSEGVGEIREKAEELLRQIERLEGRLETAEMQEITLRESLRREKEHSEALRAELEAERSRRGEEGRGGWRRLFGG
jgi:TolA-binding protein